MKDKKVIRKLLISTAIIIVAVIADFIVQDYIYKNKYKKVEDDFSHVFQIDGIDKNDKELILTGWVFELEKDSVEEDFEIILYDYNNDKEYYMDVEDVVREDVNEYFLCEYDYSNSGFVASTRAGKLDLDNTNYEVLIRPSDLRKAYKTGIYISNGAIMFIKPEEYIPLDVEGTELEEIVNDGVLRVYRPDVGMYVYQYEDCLYWIADENYEFFMDGATPIAYQLWTSQNSNLPQHRLENNWFFDNITFSFESNEIVCGGNYRMTKSKIPEEYSIREIETGQYVEEWLWNQHFRPWYEFN